MVTFSLTSPTPSAVIVAQRQAWLAALGAALAARLLGPPASEPGARLRARTASVPQPRAPRPDPFTPSSLA